MKKLQFWAIALTGVAVMMLTACGSKDGSREGEEQTVKADGLLEGLPQIVTEAYDYVQEMQTKAQQASQLGQPLSEKDMNDFFSFMQETSEKAGKVASKLTGKKIPVDGDPYSFIKFSHAVIDTVIIKKADCMADVRLHFVPAEGYSLDNIPRMEPIYFVMLSEDNVALNMSMSYGKSANTAIQFSPNGKLSPERWATFAKITLLSQQDWNNIQRSR